LQPFFAHYIGIVSNSIQYHITKPDQFKKCAENCRTCLHNRRGGCR